MTDGYHPLPAGKIASVVTYLEMTEPPPARPPREREIADARYVIRRVEHADPAWYRALFRAVGEQWLWFSRLRVTDAELLSILNDDRVDMFALSKDGVDKGLLELDRREADEIELAFLGVTPDLIGQGAGRLLMERAIAEAWRHSPKRFHVHTCTLDHPGAVAFYMRWGFRPYKCAVEVADDPRLTGECPRSAAPHAPVLAPY